MILRYILSLALSALTFSCSNSLKEDCSKFRNGMFKYHGTESNSDYVIERNDSIQIERNTTTGHVVKTKIRWTDECNYELLYVSENDAGDYQIVESLKPKPLKSKIIKVKKEYCVFTSQMDGVDRVLTDTLWLYRN